MLLVPGYNYITDFEKVLFHILVALMEKNSAAACFGDSAPLMALITATHLLQPHKQGLHDQV